MSKIKNKRLKKLGLKSRTERRNARKYISLFAKCNIGYGFNNYAFNAGKLDSFSKFATSLKD